MPDPRLALGLHGFGTIPAMARARASSALIWIILGVSFALSPIDLPLGHHEPSKTQI